MNSRRSTALFVVGIVFLVFGLVLYLTWWYFASGMIALALGALMVLLSKKPRMVKGLVAGIPVLFVAWSFIQSFAPAQTFLIPSGYSGRFTVIEGEPCGTPDVKQAGRLVVTVPANGIVILQREPTGGWVDDEFYFVDGSGTRTPIAISIVPLDPATTRPSVMHSGSGSVGGTMPDGGSSTEAPDAIHYSDYYVLTTDSNTSFYESEFDDLMVSQVKACRDNAR